MRRTTIENDLRVIVGDKATTSAFECSFYASDFVPIPTWVKTFFEATPIAVVKPGTAEEVSGAMRYCSDQGRVYPSCPKVAAPPVSLAQSPRTADQYWADMGK